MAHSQSAMVGPVIVIPGELGRLAGGMDDAAVSLPLRRFSEHLTRTPKLRRIIAQSDMKCTKWRSGPTEIGLAALGQGSEGGGTHLVSADSGLARKQ